MARSFPSGCWISSSVFVPIGTIVPYYNFCGLAEEVLLIEEATVRWIDLQESALLYNGQFR
ncbi:MAG: hypothetical protein NNA18_00270 [Nitrospira sp.]|nr:hypothetical protein [Nitrospira sp.]